MQEPVQLEAGSGGDFTALLIACVFVRRGAGHCPSAPGATACGPGGRILSPGDLAKCPLQLGAKASARMGVRSVLISGLNCLGVSSMFRSKVKHTVLYYIIL